MVIGNVEMMTSLVILYKICTHTRGSTLRLLIHILNATVVKVWKLVKMISRTSLYLLQLKIMAMSGPTQNGRKENKAQFQNLLGLPTST
jgi:hypothetical protein